MLITLGIAMTLALIVVVGALQIAGMRRMSHMHKALTEAAARQEALLTANGNAVLKLGLSLQGLEQRVTLTARRQQDLENKDAGSLTYDQASKLIQMGAAPEDLVKTCGLSQAEAKLVSLMAARGVGRPA